MAPTTVHVPEPLAALFERAEDVVGRYFAERSEQPSRGTISIAGERYVLVRAASLSVEFFAFARSLYGAEREDEADEFARDILFDLAHAVGKADARNLHARMQLEEPLARLSAGPVFFAHTGWASVTIDPASRPIASEAYRLVYEHPCSFESDAWLEAGQAPSHPVCVMNAGYSSGWCEVSFGVPLVAAEVLCRARGDDACRFVMAHPSRIAAEIDAWRQAHPESAARTEEIRIPDLFARRRVEEQLRTSHEALERRVRRRTRQLEEWNRRLREEMALREEAEAKLRQAQKLEAIGLLAGGIAHDFNNLLGSILTRSSLVGARCRPDDPIRREMERIRAACQRGAALTRQLLAFSRVQQVSKEPLDVSSIVFDLGTTLLPLVGEDVRFGSQLASELPVIEADRCQIEQVVMNLVVNARDAMPSGGAVAVTTELRTLASRTAFTTGLLEPADYVVLSVTDTGTGMDAATISKIFDPFFTTKPEGKGSGLGLSTVYGIVQQAGGAIQVRSQPGRGTTFEVYFPSAGRVAQPRPLLPARPPQPAQSHRSVLLVEDEEDLRDCVAQVLIGAGYEVRAAGDPATALGIVERGEHFDVLLSDLVMPQMSGRALADAVKRRQPEIHVLFMSGYDRERALAPDSPSASEAPVLQKPFSVDQLTRKLGDILAS